MLTKMVSGRNRRVRRLGSAAVLALALAAATPVATADAVPADRAAALDAFLDLVDASKVPAGWTGSPEGCVQGAESAASIEATRTGVNILRDFAGLTPVSFDAELNRKALAAALMMLAANELSHDPGPGWPCYTADGDEAAGQSNLFLGSSGAAAMTGYVDDGGVASLGHRRWVLNPPAATFGTGSTGASNALWVFGPAAPAPVIPEVVAWPPAGHVPWPLVFADWSAAISVPGDADLSAATVTTVLDGQPLETTNVTPLPDGYGTGRTLKWNVGLAGAARERDGHVDVTIGNVLVDGAPREFRYALDAFPVLPPLAPTFTGARTRDAVTLSWQAATERGVPVTGYRLVGVDGAGRPEFDTTVGRDARQATIAHADIATRLLVRVIPLSRAGSPNVEPVALAPLAARVSARLRVRRIAVTGGRLGVAVRLIRRADGQRIRVRVRGGGRTASYRAPIRGGRARFDIALSRRHRRARRLAVTVVYAGNDSVRAASRRYVFTGPVAAGRP
jgi:hypothetical protein